MDAKDLVVWALEASMSFEPRRPGLTIAELSELGAHFAITPSALENQLRGRALEGGRVIPFGIDPSFFANYDGDLRNVRAFDHVVTAFKQVADAAGQRPPMVDRDAIVASGTAAGLPEADLELAIATYRAFEGVSEADSRWELRRIKPTSTLPSAQREGPARKVTRRERYAELVGLVRALIDKRLPSPAARAVASPAAAAPAPARASAAAAAQVATRSAPPAPAPAAPARPAVDAASEPIADFYADGEGLDEAAADDDELVAFRLMLPSLGHGRLVQWWAQLAHDLRVADENEATLSRCTLAATMAEAALMIAVPRPREPRPVGPNAKPARWGLVEVAKAAASIGVDERLRGRLERVQKTRLRLNAAKVLEATGNLGEVGADDAREAGRALRATVRIVIAATQKSRGR